MSIWDQRVREHRVWTEMKELGASIDLAAERAAGIEQATSAAERARTALEYCGKRIAAADPMLTTTQPLDDIANSCSSARTELLNFASNGNMGHLINANTHVDRFLNATALLPVTQSPEEMGELVTASIRYRERIEQGSANVRESFEKATQEAHDFKKQIVDMKASIDSEKQNISKLASEYQLQFSSSQEARSKDFAETLRNADQGILKLQTDYQAQFSSAQDTRSKDFTEAQTARQTAASELAKQYEKRFDDQEEELANRATDLFKMNTEKLDKFSVDYAARADRILNDVTEKQQHVEKLVGVIGNLGVTSGYLRAANRAQWAMWLWQFLTVSSLVTLTVLAYKTLHVIEDSKGAMNWIGFAGRVLLLVSVGAIAGYSGFQADKLFADEKRNRKLALELEAIGPYLAPLPVEDQNKFRLQIGSRSFGRDIESVIHKHKRSPVSMVELSEEQGG